MIYNLAIFDIFVLWFSTFYKIILLSIFFSKKETDDGSATFIMAEEKKLGTKYTVHADYSRIVSHMTIGSNETSLTAGENKLGSKYGDHTDYSGVNSPMTIGSNIKWEGTQ